MRRADRLFELILLLGRGRVLTAEQIAARLEVSRRTVYRDIADLMASGTPIEGEAGVGYRMRPGYQVPPLMFDAEELQALVFGAGVARAWADPELARAAERVLAKVDAVLPARLRERLHDETLLAPGFHVHPRVVRGMADLRRAIDGRLLVLIRYEREHAGETERTVWPLGLAFWGRSWTLGGWCELRGDFRTFRLDRIAALDVQPVQYPDIPGRRLRDYIAHASRGSG